MMTQLNSLKHNIRIPGQLVRGIVLSACMFVDRLPAAEPDLTFLLTFDKNSVVADHANGDRASTTFDDILEFCTFSGGSGVRIVQPDGKPEADIFVTLAPTTTQQS